MADNTKTSKFTFEKHKPLDSMDVSFRIKGHELKWLAPQAQENTWGRIWRVLRKSDLSPELIEELTRKNHNIFQNGDTIRYNEMVLAYASKEEVDAVKAENDQAAKEAMEAIYSRHKSQNSKHLSLDLKETGVERVGADSFNN